MSTMSDTAALPCGIAVLLAFIHLPILYVAIYRLFFHPFAKVPGPKLAALTSTHEFYYECVEDGGGQHASKVQETYRIYGIPASSTHCPTAADAALPQAPLSESVAGKCISIDGLIMRSGTSSTRIPTS